MPYDPDYCNHSSQSWYFTASMDRGCTDCDSNEQAEYRHERTGAQERVAPNRNAIAAAHAALDKAISERPEGQHLHIPIFGVYVTRFPTTPSLENTWIHGKDKTYLEAVDEVVMLQRQNPSAVFVIKRLDKFDVRKELPAPQDAQPLSSWDHLKED